VRRTVNWSIRLKKVFHFGGEGLDMNDRTFLWNTDSIVGNSGFEAGVGVACLLSWDMVRFWKYFRQQRNLKLGTMVSKFS
jgi:hypothetical protein